MEITAISKAFLADAQLGSLFEASAMTDQFAFSDAATTSGAGPIMLVSTSASGSAPLMPGADTASLAEGTLASVTLSNDEGVAVSGGSTAISDTDVFEFSTPAPTAAVLDADIAASEEQLVLLSSSLAPDQRAGNGPLSVLDALSDGSQEILGIEQMDAIDSVSLGIAAVLANLDLLSSISVN